MQRIFIYQYYYYHIKITLHTLNYFTFWKIVKSISPAYLQNYLLVIQYSRNPTRQNLFSVVIPSKTDYFGNSFFFLIL